MKEKEILVSIITVCYNSEKTISRTIESVLKQTYKNVEYIIVDGMSTDRTAGIVQSYVPKFGDSLIFICEKDKGIYDAMNKGIDHAHGEIIGIINSDDFYEPDAIEKVVQKYNGQENTVFYGKMHYINRKGEKQGIHFNSHENLEKEMICHPSCFVTKDTYENFGKFNTKYSCVADYDLMLRYKRTGKVSFIPIDEVLSNFTIGGTCSTQKAFFDLLDLQVDYGMIRKRDAFIQKLKAVLSNWLFGDKR